MLPSCERRAKASSNDPGSGATESYRRLGRHDALQVDERSPVSLWSSCLRDEALHTQRLASLLARARWWFAYENVRKTLKKRRLARLRWRWAFSMLRPNLTTKLKQIDCPAADDCPVVSAEEDQFDDEYVLKEVSNMTPEEIQESAIENYAHFYQLDPEEVKLKDIEASCAGLERWAVTRVRLPAKVVTIWPFQESSDSERSECSCEKVRCVNMAGDELANLVISSEQSVAEVCAAVARHLPYSENTELVLALPDARVLAASDSSAFLPLLQGRSESSESIQVMSEA